MVYLQRSPNVKYNKSSPEASSSISDYLTLPSPDYLTNLNTNNSVEGENDDDDDDYDDDEDGNNTEDNEVEEEQRRKIRPDRLSDRTISGPSDRTRPIDLSRATSHARHDTHVTHVTRRVRETR